MDHLTLFYMYLLAALVAGFIPILGKYIGVVNTLIHEASHCLMALLFSGKVHSISLFSDTSGVATTSAGRFSRILVSYAGYTGSSIAAVLLSYLLHSGKYIWVIYSFAALTLICLLLWVRNIYGLLWSVSFLVIFYFLISRGNDLTLLHSSYFLSSIVIVNSFTSTITIMKLSIKEKDNAGDATNLAQATFIPASIWGVLFFTQSIYSLFYIYQHYIT